MQGLHAQSGFGFLLIVTNAERNQKYDSFCTFVLHSLQISENRDSKFLPSPIADLKFGRLLSTLPVGDLRMAQNSRPVVFKWIDHTRP